MGYRRPTGLPEPKALVEQFEAEIKSLLRRFRILPYAFYTETGMHCYLYHRLYASGLPTGCTGRRKATTRFWSTRSIQRSPGSPAVRTAFSRSQRKAADAVPSTSCFGVSAMSWKSGSSVATRSESSSQNEALNMTAASPLDSGFGFSYLPNLHVGATSWYLIAAGRGNPYQL